MACRHCRRLPGIPYPATRTASYEVLQTFKLARYCAEFWFVHALEAEELIESTSRIAVDMFSTGNPAHLTWIRLHDPDNPKTMSDHSKTIEMIASPLYYAALLGLTRVVKMSLDKGVEVSKPGGRYGTAFQAAAAKGHNLVFELLHDHGADRNA
jgi:hypothetical protein